MRWIATVTADRQPSMTSAAVSRSGSVPYLAVVCAVAIGLSSAGMWSEGTVSLQGDMPRYLVNGTYFLDLLRDLPLADPVGYTYRYFARYPALSLGHHPLLLSLSEVPFFALFGVSVWSGRLLLLCFTVIGLVAWFHTVRVLYDSEVAFFAALLLATTPYVVRFSRIVMSEVPALSMLLVTMYFFIRYCELQRRRDLILCALMGGVSVFAKHHVILMFPVLVVYLVWRRGVRALLTRDAIWAVLIVGALLLPLIPITLEFARANINWVRHATPSARLALPNLLYFLIGLWKYQVTAPVLVFAGLGVVLGVVKRDARVVFPVFWIVGFYVLITYLSARQHRYAIFWIPAFCLLAASIVAETRTRPWRPLAAAALLLVSAYQLVAATMAEPTRAEGYEAAARYVIDNGKGESVLFAGAVDSGFFVFFVRKHDPERRLVVLRADKTIVTSNLARIVAENRTTRDQIVELLRDFGTRYVVVEDAPFASPSLELLRQELHGEDFELRERIPFDTNSDKLEGVALAIYEYKGYTPARDDAVLKMRVPLAAGDVSVSMQDLRSGLR